MRPAVSSSFVQHFAITATYGPFVLSPSTPVIRPSGCRGAYHERKRHRNSETQYLAMGLGCIESDVGAGNAVDGHDALGEIEGHRPARGQAFTGAGGERAG